LQFHISFYKTWREFIRKSTCHLLTPISTIDDRSGWIAFQFQNSSQPGVSLVYVYRLSDELSSRTFPLNHIDQTRSYLVTSIDALDSPQVMSGYDLRFSGLRAELPTPNGATIFIVQEQINK
jgi:hypothetical protein